MGSLFEGEDALLGMVPVRLEPPPLWPVRRIYWCCVHMRGYSQLCIVVCSCTCQIENMALTGADAHMHTARC